MSGMSEEGILDVAMCHVVLLAFLVVFRSLGSPFTSAVRNSTALVVGVLLNANFFLFSVFDLAYVFVFSASSLLED